VKERVVVFVKGDRAYYLDYENSAKNFNKYDKAFTHIIKSLIVK